MLGGPRPKSEANRDLLLKHPDLAEELRKLYRMQDPSQWHGYLPPERDEFDRPNRSRYRERLVQLLTEARRRNAENAPSEE